MFCRFGFALLFVLNASLFADEPVVGNPTPQAKADPGKDEATEPAFVLSDEVRDVLLPLFSSIAKADVSRATVEMLADSVVGGAVVESQRSTFQIASNPPNRFTIYLKESEQRTRVYNDGKSMVVALAPDAYCRLADAISTQDAVTDLPIPLGAYPEPVLALTLAGVDPAVSLIDGMKSIEIVDRDDFREQLPSIHLRGVQDDQVTWDFWISQGKQPKPLRLLVDLTPILRASEQVQIPAGFSYQVRFDFLSWRITGDVDESLFTYTPPKDSKEYQSLEDYYESVAGVVGEHPLLGKPAPPFKTTTLSGKQFDSAELADTVVVLDFWATWCTPCLAAMPILKEVTDEYADKGVVFFALNTGEEKQQIEEFLKEKDFDISVLLDPKGKVADAFAADAIPQTILIGKSGDIESVHVGFPGAQALMQRLRDELDVLCVGGKIGSISSQATEKDSEKDKSK